ncbi:MAG TPA: threonine synthase [Thermoanaerobaculia bacterium]|jgi:threonine synthase|nr:threonine synthase [Thermoanaerobaculia bacterium]
MTEALASPAVAAAAPRWATHLECSRTGVTAPLDEPASLSPAGAPWLVRYDLAGRDGAAWKRALQTRDRGLWRYRELLPVVDFQNRVDLGEGGTPLVPLRRLAPRGVEALIKDEAGNPTGSFKARGMALAITRARELDIPGVELASAGNAALAACAYAAAAGMRARVAMPPDTPGAIAARCRSLGAEVLLVGATLVESRAALLQKPAGLFDLSTFREPYRVEGKKTMGLEIAEQLDWELPEWILYPTGGGTGIVGMIAAFEQLQELGLVGPRLPRLVVVQAEGCAPIARALERGGDAEPWEDPQTRAWGLRVPRALAAPLILAAVRKSGGCGVTVSEDEMTDATSRLARAEGMEVGPEGAAAFVALEKLAARGALREGERVVVFQTGSPWNYLEHA